MVEEFKLVIRTFRYGTDPHLIVACHFTAPKFFVFGVPPTGELLHLSHFPAVTGYVKYLNSNAAAQHQKKHYN